MKNKVFFAFRPLPFAGVFVFTIIFLSSCSSDYSPKPRAYFHIDLPDPVYHSVQFSPFDFSLSDQAQIENRSDSASAIGFNLNYPKLNVRIYCSYFSINKDNFKTIADKSQRLVYIHEMRADGIKEYAFTNPGNDVYGIVYEIEGNVASPLQFVLTDSVRSFFRGALYFNAEPNRDSIAPVLAYINKDIQILIESFRWRR
ncbi:MAG: gliding motility lipoprotein GldD [Dysgonamonadaceae bacterium]|jgi:gliding motility-associated lipoprotein GldD|nr:gliding motility lipoprotein GldD [Dysgonamonadaceae bacterium]